MLAPANSRSDMESVEPCTRPKNALGLGVEVWVVVGWYERSETRSRWEVAEVLEELEGIDATGSGHATERCPVEPIARSCRHLQSRTERQSRVLGPERDLGY
jgi:hypothetical protein